MGVEVNKALNDRIVQLRDEGGLSFREIGLAVGMKKAATHQRYIREKERRGEEWRQGSEEARERGNEDARGRRGDEAIAGQAGEGEGEHAREEGSQARQQGDGGQVKQAGDQAQAVTVAVKGIGPNADLIDPDELWRRAFNAQDTVRELAGQRRKQAIVIQDSRPVGLAFLSDVHFGSAETDYRAAKADAELIAGTPGLYCEYHGDGWDNWIPEKLQKLERGQALRLDAEVQLFVNYLRMLKGKLLFAIPGNHDLWTETLAGIDLVREALRDTVVLYDRYEVNTVIQVGGSQWRLKARHKWRYSSIFNPTHGIETGWERGGDDFDIGLGGHTHIGTLCRTFVKHGRKRFAILTGTYKVHDEYGRELGLAEPFGTGCGAVILYPDGRLFWCEDLRTTVDFLNHLRQGK